MATTHTQEVDVAAAVERISAQESVSRLLAVASAELAELLDAQRVSVSRVIGDLLVELAHHERSGKELPLELFLVTDYPLTQEVIDEGVPRVVRRSDPGADAAEAALLDRLGFDSVAMLPLRSGGQSWGLVELYGRDDAFAPAQVDAAARVVAALGDLLAGLEGRG